MNYYGRLKKLWDDINDFDALPTCTCSGCTCEINTLLRTRKESDMVREFLMGLDKYYATVRSSIIGIEPLPSLHTVYARLDQEEEVHLVTKPKTEVGSQMAYVVHHQPRAAGGPRPIPKCTFCNKNSHLEDRCWEKHGFPKGRKPRRQEKQPGGEALLHATTLSPSTSTAKGNVLLGEQSANTVRLNGKDSLTWIVDTGASTHV
ncbi:hypothetical protein vseg_000852 [Gypsophila vaccaria]